MQTRLILIRHGADHHKADRVVGGPNGCRGLTDAGRNQASALARRLVRELDQPPSAVYSSVLLRAVETAEILATALGRADVVQDCGLCTWHTPEHADGKLWSEYRREHRLAGGGVFRPFERDNETWSELVARTGRALEYIDHGVDERWRPASLAPPTLDAHAAQRQRPPVASVRRSRNGVKRADAAGVCSC